MLLILHGTPGFACLPVSLTIIPSCVSKNTLQSWVCSPAKGKFWQNVKPSQNARDEKGHKTNPLSGLDLTKHEKKKGIKRIKRTLLHLGQRRKPLQDCWRWKTGNSKEEYLLASLGLSLHGLQLPWHLHLGQAHPCVLLAAKAESWLWLFGNQLLQESQLITDHD